jgi:hypothetical protein
MLDKSAVHPGCVATVAGFGVEADWDAFVQFNGTSETAILAAVDFVVETTSDRQTRREMGREGIGCDVVEANTSETSETIVD